jgi:hypothetical protein
MGILVYFTSSLIQAINGDFENRQHFPPSLVFLLFPIFYVGDSLVKVPDFQSFSYTGMLLVHGVSVDY